MAILKFSKAKALTRKATTDVVRYVLDDEKTPDKIMGVTGTYRYDEITPSNIAKSFWANKNKWGKLDGRQYHHAIISFHKDEPITPLEVYDIAQDFCAEAYPGHQALIVVHQDPKGKKGLHAHIILDSVSYIDGLKIHRDRDDTEQQKEICNKICKDRGFSIPRKGKNFHGHEINPDQVISWDKNTHKTLTKANPRHKASETNIDMLKLVLLIIQALLRSRSIADFIEYMKRNSWKVTWTENRKHITFESTKTERKFRASNVDKTYGAKLRHVFGQDFVLDKDHMKKMCETNLNHKIKLYGSRADIITNEVKVDIINVPKEPENYKNPNNPWEPTKPQKKTPSKKKETQKPKNQDWEPPQNDIPNL